MDINDKALDAEIALLEQRIIALRLRQNSRALILERFPDEHAEGSVLVWEKTFSEGGPTYTFAGVKAGGLWHVTGKWQAGLMWPRFVEKFLADADRVWVVTTMEEV